MRRAAAALALLAGCAAPQERSDWAATLPPVPGGGELLEVEVSPRGAVRFFVDPASVSVGSDGIVRYVLVARGAGGAETVTYEGLRCASAEVRVYAVGRGEAWGGQPGQWRPVSADRWHFTLHRDYFCPQRQPIASAREGVDALRRGGHPLADDFGSDMPRGR